MGSITSPRDLSGLTLWFDATDTTTYTVSSSKITEWRDKSIVGSSKKLSILAGTSGTSATSEFQTLTIQTNDFATRLTTFVNGLKDISVATGDLNGKDTIRFTNGFMKYIIPLTSPVFSNYSASSTFAGAYITCVFKVDSNNVGHPFNITNVNSANTWYSYEAANSTTASTNYRASIFNGSGNDITEYFGATNRITSTGTITNASMNDVLNSTNYFIYTIVVKPTFAPTKTLIYLNGQCIASVNTPYSSTSTLDFFNARIGGAITHGFQTNLVGTTRFSTMHTGSGFNGNIAEIIAYNDQIDFARMARVHNYLEQKWFNNSITLYKAPIDNYTTYLPTVMFFESQLTTAQNVAKITNLYFTTTTVKIYTASNTDIETLTTANLPDNASCNIRVAFVGETPFEFTATIYKVTTPSIQFIESSATSFQQTLPTITGATYAWFKKTSTQTTYSAVTGQTTTNLNTTISSSTDNLASFYGRITYSASSAFSGLQFETNPTTLILMSSIISRVQYFAIQGSLFVIDTNSLLDAIVDPISYQWKKDGVAVSGQTSKNLVINNPTLQDSGAYTLEILYNGITYTTPSTSVDIIQAIPYNIQRPLVAGERIDLSVNTIPGATYQWQSAVSINNIYTAITNQTTTSYSFTFGANPTVNDYKVFRVSITKNGITGFSNECVFSRPSPFIFTKQIQNNVRFPVNASTYTMLDSTPDGRLVFCDNSTPRRLFLTDAGMGSSAYINPAMKLYEVPTPPVAQITTLYPYLQSFTRFFCASAADKPIFIDGARAFTGDGAYMAILFVGTVRYYKAPSNIGASTDMNFIQIYKISDNGVLPVQQILINYVAGNGGTIIDNQSNAFYNNSTPPPYVTFSKDGNYFGIALCASSFNRKVYVLKKSGTDTWGTVNEPSTTNSNSIATTDDNNTFNLMTPAAVYAISLNNDGSILSCAYQGAPITTGTNANRSMIVYQRSGGSYNIFQTFMDKIYTEISGNILGLGISTTYPNFYRVPYRIYFSSDESRITLISNCPISSLSYTTNHITKAVAIVFSYNSTTQDVRYLYHFNREMASNTVSDFNITPDHTIIYTNDNRSSLVDICLYRVPSFYANMPTRYFRPTPDIPITQPTLVSTQPNLSNTTPLITNANFIEKSSSYIYNNTTQLGAYITQCAFIGNKLILYKEKDKQLLICDYSYGPSNVKPTIQNTSAVTIATQDERTNGAKIYIQDLLNTKLNDSSTYNLRKEGILLRIKNQKETINGVSQTVGNWKLVIPPFVTGLMEELFSGVNLNLRLMSESYSSRGGTDKWYFYKNPVPTNNTIVTTKPYIQLDMSSGIFFNNEIYPDTKISLEYKFWNGYGYDDINTKNTSGNNPYYVDGAIITILDQANTPFSDETGELQIQIRNTIDCPDFYGRIIVPRITGLIDNTNRKYIHKIQVLKNTFFTPPFSLEDLIDIFRPTISVDYPVTDTNPTKYTSNEYKGGFMILPTKPYSLQLSIDNGQTWYYLQISTTNGTGSASVTTMVYFFHPKKCNYLFRMGRWWDFSKTGTTPNTPDVYVYPWNGENFIRYNTSNQIDLVGSYIRDFSELNPTKTSILWNIPSTRIATAEIQKASTLPSPGKYVTSDNTSGFASLNQCGLVFEQYANTAPVWKNTDPFTIKKYDTATNTVIDDTVNDSDDASAIYTPFSILYGPLINGVRRTDARTIRIGTSSSDNCDVYDPDISGDYQILGMVISRNEPSLQTEAGDWQFLNTLGIWENMFINTTTQFIRIWSFKFDDTRTQFRFKPKTVEKTTYVELPFYIYDGSDFVPFNYQDSDTKLKGTIESSQYDINQTTNFSYLLSTITSATAGGSAITSNSRTATTGKLVLRVNHVNGAPTLTIPYSVSNSTPYRYNSGTNITLNNGYSLLQDISSFVYNVDTTTSQLINVYNGSIVEAKTYYYINRTITYNKNKFRVELADILNSTNIRDIELTSPLSLALYSGQTQKGIVKVFYNDDTIDTITSFNPSMPYHLKNFIRGNPPYTLSIVGNSAIRMWTYLANPNLGIRTGNHIFMKSGNTELVVSIQYYNNVAASLLNNLTNNGPKLIPNVVNGNSVLRFIRSDSPYLIFYKGGSNQPVTNFISSGNDIGNISNFFLVERRRSNAPNGLNPLLASNDGLFYFGYKNDIITLEYTNSGQSPVVLTYSDSSLAYDGTKCPTRMWHVETIHKSNISHVIRLSLNGVVVASTTALTPLINQNTNYYMGASYASSTFTYYDGDICDFLIYTANTTDATKLAFEQYMAHTWINPQIYIEPAGNETIDLSYNFYIWDRSNDTAIQTTTASISSRGGSSAYSTNAGSFTLNIQKANSRPVLSMNASTTDNTAILPPNSTATKLAFKLGDLDMATQTHDFPLLNLFDDIIKNRYTDDDSSSSNPDSKGLAITNIDTTLGTWSVVKSNGTTETLTGISTTSAYLIKRDSSGNKLRLTLNSTTNSTTNRFHTSTTAGLPGSSFFQAIGWDATNASYSEYSKVNLTTAANPTDVENSFSIVANGVFEFRVSTRPYITGAISKNIFVYNSDPTLATLTPNTLLNLFNTSQITSGTKRIDVYNVDNLDSTVTLQYQVGSSWTNITLPLTTPINGTYPIRIKESTADKAVNKTFSLLMALYDSGTGLYSPNFGSINIKVEEANLPPSIQTNPSAITIFRQRIADITSSTITYETVFNDIGNGTGTELPPIFNFVTYTAFNTTNNKPITWTDQNVSSNLKLNAFGIQIMNSLNGRFYYADENGDFKDIVVTKTTDRFLLSSINTLKYIPTPGNSGKALIRIYAWDGVQGTTGTRAEVDANGTYTQGAFSTNYITVEFPVIPRNNAPSFITDNKFYSSVIQQTDTNADISGVSIKSIIANTIGFDYLDLNSVNEKGLVILDTSGAGLGTWQSSINGGGTWATATTGLHLLADNADANRLRFNFNTSRTTYPNSYSEIPTVRVAAWDKTNTVINGSIATIDTSGGATAYSSETVYLGATISHRNHRPTLTTGTTRFNIGSVNANSTIDISFQTILTSLGSAIGDPDIGTSVGIKILDISFNNTPQAGITMGSWTYTDSILSGNYTPLTNTTELIPSRNPILRFQSDKYVYGATTLSFCAFDEELTSTNSRTLSLTINDINYAPTFSNNNDISYNVVFDVSRTILVSSLINAMNPSDRNIPTTYGIVISASSFDPNIALIQYTTNAAALIPTYNTITNSLVGTGSTAIHIPSNGALLYTPKFNQPIQNTFDIYLWDRSNNSAYASAVGNALTVPTSRDEFSPYSASSIKLSFQHTQINYAPTILTGSTTLTTIDALSTTSIYTIPSLLTQINWSDANNGDKRGLVICATDMCGGTYEYTLNGGSSWTTVPSTLSLTNGLHFDDQTTAAIRYVSTRNTTDFSTLTIVGWDQSTPVTHGTTASIPSTRGGNTPYSVNTHTLRIEQTHVNSRPTLTNGTSRTTSSVNYHPTDYTWFQFSTYVPISTTFSDADYSLVRRGGTSQIADKTFGILITAADISAGNWLISSDKRIITEITTANQSSAVIVSPSDYFALRTSKNNASSFRLTYKAWDKSSRTTTTTVDTTDVNNTSYSVNSGTIIVPVDHVNTPPSINASATGYEAPTIAGDGDDNPDISGIPITSIIDDLITRGVYTDPDNTLWGYTNEPKGLIFLGATLATTVGTWAYSTNGGTSWASIPTTETNRLHLTYSASNRIRYRPSNNTNGRAVLRVAAWDQANGVSNGTVQAVSSTQRTDAIGQSYSVNETTVTFPTAYLNHAPTFGTSSYTMPTVEFGNVNNGKDWVSILTALSYSDKDTQDPRGVVVGTITIPADVSGVFQVLAGTTWSTLTTGLQFTLPSYTSLRFVPSANITLDSVNVSVALRPYDGLATGSTSATIVVPVKKALFSPTITATLSTNLIQRFRADNKLSTFGGVSQGVSMTKLLNDMGFTDQSAGDGRGIAIQSLTTKGVTGYFEVKLGNASWTRIPTISTNSFYLLGEFTDSVVNRIRFFSTSSKNTGFIGIVFFGWDQSDKNPTTGIVSGVVKQYTTRPTSFSARNGTYRMEIQRIVGR